MGRGLSPEVKTVIYNVVQYFRKRKADRESIEFKTDANIGKIVAEATGYCEGTIRRVAKEGRASIANLGRLDFNAPKNPQIRKKKYVIDDSKLDIIRRKIDDFYEVDKEMPTLRKLLESLKRDGVLDCGREYLRTLVHKMGYRFEKGINNRPSTIEQPNNITRQRRLCLTKIRNFATLDRHIYFIDQTYINASHKANSSSKSEIKLEPGIEASIKKERCLIILHAGYNGLTRDEVTVFKPSEEISANNEIMDEPSFYEWTKEKLKRNLMSNSIVIIENADDQSDSKPTALSPKTEIHDWLHRHNIEFQANMTKSELLQLINYTQEPEYRISRFLEASSHTVFYLPPCDAHINPFELIRVDIQNNVDQNETSSLPGQSTNMLNRLFSEMEETKFAKSVNNVKTEPDQDYDMNYGVYDSIIIKEEVTFSSSDPEKDCLKEEMESMSE